MCEGEYLDASMNSFAPEPAYNTTYCNTTVSPKTFYENYSFYEPPTEAPTGIPASISFDQDDEVAMQTRDIVIATLAFVLVGSVIAMSYFYYKGKNIVVTPSTSSSPMHSKQEL